MGLNLVFWNLFAQQSGCAKTCIDNTIMGETLSFLSLSTEETCFRNKKDTEKDKEGKKEKLGQK